MQDNSAKKNRVPNDRQQRADDEEINQRLVEHLKANAIRENRSVAEDNRIPQRGFFAEVFAILGLVGLMIVAYLYSTLVGEKA
jgi:hypothetical protein